jgi:hypothetical protein
MSERRYNEDEVAQIFERATEAQKASLPAARPVEGLTLRELQEVGRDVGLPPELVERAARSLDVMGQGHGRKLLGFIPIGVGRTVELPRPLTEAEWHRLVSDLRETFDARGKLAEHGPFKQWTNGNLQALLEPTPDGQRLRLKTLKGSAMSMMGTGAMMLGITGAIWVSMMLRAAPFDGGAFGVLMLTGLGLLIGGLVPLPSWARTRQRQMEEIAERLSLATTTATKPDGGSGASEP